MTSRRQDAAVEQPAAEEPPCKPLPAPKAQNPMVLWDEFKRTDPAATKPFQKSGGFRGTQIDPVWRIKRMTEVFGPIGMRWGYAIHERWKETLNVKVKNGPREPVDTVFVRLSAWYMWEGHRCETGEQIGGTQVEYAPDEAYKMAVTDALGKSLSQIGLGADIYMGQFDDSKYREESESFYAAKNNPDTQPQAIERFEQDLLDRMRLIVDLDGLDELWRSGVGARIREIGIVDKAAQGRIVSLFSAKKAEIQKAEEEGKKGGRQDKGEQAAAKADDAGAGSQDQSTQAAPAGPDGPSIDGFLHPPQADGKDDYTEWARTAMKKVFPLFKHGYEVSRWWSLHNVHCAALAKSNPAAYAKFKERYEQLRDKLIQAESTTAPSKQAAE